MNATKLGDRVRVHYTGRFEDGTVFETSKGLDPLEFKAGSDEVILGLSEAVIGMQIGDSKTVVVSPENAYGPRKPGLEFRVSRNEMPKDVQVGDPLQVSVDDRSLVVWITEIGEDSATLDANHPLAGRTLIFDIELL